MATAVNSANPVTPPPQSTIEMAMGETATNLRIDTQESNELGRRLEQRNTSLLTQKNDLEQFNQTVINMEHKLMPQYQVK